MDDKKQENRLGDNVSNVNEDKEKEFRKQRHDFLLKYYEMATKDLDRHLHIGWQTTTVIASSVASLALGYKGELPLPIAVGIAIAILGFGACNILKTNYWAVRAIAFLANVESVYFQEDDRRCFNEYAGLHPPLHLIANLKHQFVLIFVFVGIAIIFFVSNLLDAEVFGGNILRKVQGIRWSELVLWLVPVLTLCSYVYLLLKTDEQVTNDYLSFVRNSPGPGMLKCRGLVRTVDLGDEVDRGKITSGEEMQSKVLYDLQSKLKRKKRRNILSNIVLIVILVILMIFVLYKKSRHQVLPEKCKSGKAAHFHSQKFNDENSPWRLIRT